MKLNYKFAFSTVLGLFFASLSAQTLPRAKDCETILVTDAKESAYPRLSADGKKILYQSNLNGNWQVLVFDSEKKQEHQVTDDSHNNNFPDWSYDNQLISFVSDRDGNE